MASLDPVTAAVSAEAAPLCIGGPLGSMVRTLSRQVDDLAAGHGLSADRWYVLDEIVQHDGIPMTELARKLSIPAPTLTKLVDRLVSDALAFRLADHSDRRRVLVHASRRGSILHENLFSDIRRLEAEFLANLSNSDTAILRHIIESAAQHQAIHR